jgi:hypothetical protein
MRNSCYSDPQIGTMPAAERIGDRFPESHEDSSKNGRCACCPAYLRREWEHGASPVWVAEVAAVRAANRERVLPWAAEELGGKAKGKGK